MNKYTLLALVLFFAAVSLYFCTARADGDKIEPSSPIREQIAQSVESCKQGCIEEFLTRIGWMAGATGAPSSPVPPDLYNRAYNIRWRCEARC